MLEKMLAITPSERVNWLTYAIYTSPCETEYAANATDERHKVAMRKISELALRVLVVDDEPNFCRVLCRQLKSDYGAHVTAVERGADALNVDLADYDVVLIDVVMPIMRGDTICTKMVERKMKVTIALMSNDPGNETVAQTSDVPFWPKGDVLRLDQILLSAGGGRNA